jgi:hypothetical protein
MLMDRARFKYEYLALIDPVDEQWHYENYEPSLWVKHQIAHYAKAQLIVEIGVRSGYSAWAMLKASPGGEYYGYDNYHPDYAKECGDRLSEKFEAWAHNILDPMGAHIVKVDTQERGFSPKMGADVYHVDGSHTYDHEKRDIVSCLRVAKPESVIAVHDYMASSVRMAVAHAIEGSEWVVHELAENRNGDALLFYKNAPAWVDQLELVKE